MCFVTAPPIDLDDIAQPARTGTRSGMPARSVLRMRLLRSENVTVSLHYWYHACDETLDGQTHNWRHIFCRLHCVFHLTVHVRSILIF